MRSVTFNFRPGISMDQQEHVLKHVNTWGDVRKASRLKPGAKHPLLSRMAYAYVTGDADLGDLVKRLSSLPEVESASIPSRRRLVKGSAERKSRGV